MYGTTKQNAGALGASARPPPHAGPKWIAQSARARTDHFNIQENHSAHDEIPCFIRNHFAISGILYYIGMLTRLTSRVPYEGEGARVPAELCGAYRMGNSWKDLLSCTRLRKCSADIAWATAPRLAGRGVCCMYVIMHTCISYYM